MADVITSGTLSVAWDGSSPATAPAGSVLQLSLNDLASVGAEITGAGTWNIVFETRIAGATWFAPNCLNVDKTAATASLSAAGRRLIQTAGYSDLRGRLASVSGGAAPVLTFAGSWVPV